MLHGLIIQGPQSEIIGNILEGFCELCKGRTESRIIVLALLHHLIDAVQCMLWPTQSKTFTSNFMVNVIEVDARVGSVTQ